MPAPSAKYAIYVSSVDQILVQRPGFPAGTWIGAKTVNSVTTWDTTTIIPVTQKEYAHNKRAYNSAIGGGLIQHSEAEYLIWIAAQDAAVDVDAMLLADFGTPQAERTLLVALLAILSDRDGVSKHDLKVGIDAVIASAPPHPFTGQTIAMLVYQELADGQVGNPINTIAVLADVTVDETTPLALLQKHLAQKLVAQNIANGG